MDCGRARIAGGGGDGAGGPRAGGGGGSRPHGCGSAGRRRRRRDASGAGEPPRPGTLQGGHSGPRRVRRPPPGYAAQSRCRRLDRGAARGGRLSDRASPLHLRAAAAPHGSTGRPAPRGGARPGRSDADGRPGRTQRQRARRKLHLRLPGANGSRPRPAGPAGRAASGPQPRGTDARPALPGLLHQGGRHAARRDVHRRRPHGRAGVRRGGRRRRVGHGTRHGAGAHPECAGRRDGGVHPLCALEQRGDRPQRQPRLRRAAAGAAGCGGSAGLRALPGAALAGDDPARHDAVRPRRPGSGRGGQPRPAARGGREHRVPVELDPRCRVAGPGVPLQGGQRRLRHGLPRHRRPAHDQYRLDPLHERDAVDQPARERTRNADRRRLEPPLASTHRPVRDLHGRRLPAGPQRRPDDAGGARRAGRRDRRPGRRGDCDASPRPPQTPTRRWPGRFRGGASGAAGARCARRRRRARARRP